MKRMTTLLALLALLLTGCGIPASEPAPAATASGDAVWGADWSMTAPDPSAAPAPETSPAPTAQTLPEPAEQTPVPAVEEQENAPASLRDLYPDTVDVWVDGVRMEGLLREDTALLSAGELSKVLPWFQGEGSPDAWTFTGQWDGQSPSIQCRTPDAFTGVECVYVESWVDEYWLPIRWLASIFSFHLLWDQEEGAVYLTARTDVDSIPWDVDVPVLMYHAVMADPWGNDELFIHPDDMRAQLEYLLDNGYDPIFFSDLTHLSDYDKPVILTFDDGYENNYTDLFPLLKEYGVKATIFVITDRFGWDRYLSPDEIVEMSQSGLVDIQSHTASHPHLPTLDYGQQEEELGRSRLAIARLTRKAPDVLCYPYGERNDDTLELARSYFSFGIDINGGVWTTAGDWYTVPRSYIARSDTLEEFASALS